MVENIFLKKIMKNKSTQDLHENRMLVDNNVSKTLKQKISNIF